MDDEHTIFRLLSLALSDVRNAAAGNDLQQAFALADLFYELPYHLERIRLEGGHYREVLDWIHARAGQKNLAHWLEGALSVPAAAR